MKRTAIILIKSLERGPAANVAACLMGQASRLVPDLYASECVLDKSGVPHIGVQYSVVILEANGPEQLGNFISKLSVDHEDLDCYFAFTRTGQGLHNMFEIYKTELSEKPTRELEITGVIVSGSDEAVRRATKKFSIFK